MSRYCLLIVVGGLLTGCMADFTPERTSVNGMWGDDCTPAPPLTSIDGTCDGIDDDCDGMIDDDVTDVVATVCPTGDCEGQVSCEDSTLSQPLAGSCGDGIDNDGDGLVDCEELQCAGVLDCPNADPHWTHRRSWPVIIQWDLEQNWSTEMWEGTSAPSKLHVYDKANTPSPVVHGFVGGLYELEFQLDDMHRRNSYFISGGQAYQTGNGQAIDIDITDVYRLPGVDDVTLLKVADPYQFSEGWLWEEKLVCYPSCSCGVETIIRGDKTDSWVDGTFVTPTVDELNAPIPKPKVVATNALKLDFDGDGDLETLVATERYEHYAVDVDSPCPTKPHVSLGFFTTHQFWGMGTPTPAVTLPGTPIDLIRGQFDGLHGEDVIIQTGNPSASRLYLSQGSSVVPAPVSLEPLGWGPFRVGDIDGDGRDDLVTTSGGLTVRYGTRSGLGPAVALLPPAGAPSKGIELGDLDGDGDDEIITSSNGDIVVYHHAPPGQLQQEALTYGGAGQPTEIQLLEDGRLMLNQGNTVTIFNTTSGTPVHPLGAAGPHCGDGVCSVDDGEGCDSCPGDCGDCSPCCSRWIAGCALEPTCVRGPTACYETPPGEYQWNHACIEAAVECGLGCPHPLEISDN